MVMVMVSRGFVNQRQVGHAMGKALCGSMML
jgi:hypothetical protein